MLRVLFAAVLAALAQLTFAQSGYPSRTINMIVGFAPGGGTDTVARIVAKKVGDSVGQTVIVENKAGAGGTVAAHQVARSASDGYTILLGNVGSLAVAPHLIAKLPYDPLHDLAPITMAVEFPNVIVVQPAMPAKTLAEFVQSRKPGRSATAHPESAASATSPARCSRSWPRSTSSTSRTKEEGRRCRTCWAGRSRR
jgi:tripartite-type tricarboxylate transporter receptor subunit TctC